MWDSIGLADERADACNEYDAYLLQAAASLYKGVATEEVIGYLVEIETEHMGLGTRADIYDRAKATVGGLRAYVASLRP